MAGTVFFFIPPVINYGPIIMLTAANCCVNFRIESTTTTVVLFCLPRPPIPSFICCSFRFMWKKFIMSHPLIIAIETLYFSSSSFHNTFKIASIIQICYVRIFFLHPSNLAGSRWNIGYPWRYLRVFSKHDNYAFETVFNSTFNSSSIKYCSIILWICLGKQKQLSRIMESFSTNLVLMWKITAWSFHAAEISSAFLY